MVRGIDRPRPVPVWFVWSNLVLLVQIGAAMKLVTFTTGGQPAVGVVDDQAQQVRDVTALLPPGTGVLQVVEGWARWGPALAERAPALQATPLDQVRLLAPIPAPR